MPAVGNSTPLCCDSQGKYVVWVLETEHKHGRDISVHISYSSAEEELLNYVKDGWTPDFGPIEDCKNPVETYFEANEDREWYDITQLHIHNSIHMPQIAL